MVKFLAQFFTLQSEMVNHLLKRVLYFYKILTLGGIARGYHTQAKPEIERFWRKYENFAGIWVDFDGFTFQTAPEIAFLFRKLYN